jgi:hypothetical protein
LPLPRPTIAIAIKADKSFTKNGSRAIPFSVAGSDPAVWQDAERRLEKTGKLELRRFEHNLKRELRREGRIFI